MAKKSYEEKKLDDNKILKLFLLISIVFGLMFVYIIPPFQSPDENSHFLKSYALSTGDVYPTVKDDAYRFKFPKSLVDYTNHYNGKMGKTDFKYSYADFYLEEYGDYSYSEKDYYTFSTAGNSPLCHTAPALGIIFTKIITHLGGNGRTSPLMMLHGARIFCLALYILLGYFSIKRTPILKKSMFLILLLPMSLYLGSSVSYDGLLLSSTLLGIAEILRLIYEKDKISRKNCLLLILIALILLSVKTIYSLMLALLLFIPKEKFGGMKDKIKSLITIAVISIVIYFILKLPFYFLSSVGSNEIVNEQLNFVLHNPFKTIAIFISNFWSSREDLMYMMIGSFGLFETKLPHLIMYLGFLGMIFIFITDASSHNYKIAKYSKILLAIIGVGLVFIIYSAMYITWTPIMTGEVGGKIVDGVQGRYFLPILIIIPYILSNNKITKNKYFNNITLFINNNYYLYSFVILLFSIIIITLRFWV